MKKLFFAFLLVLTCLFGNSQKTFVTSMFIDFNHSSDTLFFKPTLVNPCGTVDVTRTIDTVNGYLIVDYNRLCSAWSGLRHWMGSTDAPSIVFKKRFIEIRFKRTSGEFDGLNPTISFTVSGGTPDGSIGKEIPPVKLPLNDPLGVWQTKYYQLEGNADTVFNFIYYWLGNGTYYFDYIKYGDIITVPLPTIDTVAAQYVIGDNKTVHQVSLTNISATGIAQKSIIISAESQNTGAVKNLQLVHLGGGKYIDTINHTAKLQYIPVNDKYSYHDIITVTVTDTVRKFSAKISFDVNIMNSFKRDTSLAAGCGDSVEINVPLIFNSYEYTYKWEPATGLSDPDSPITFAKPTIETTYILSAKKDTNTFYDTVTVTFKNNSNPPSICLVSIDPSSNKNLIIWERVNGNGIKYYKIYREKSTNVYDSIGYRTFDSIGVFKDNGSKPDIRAERYKISAVDICGTESLKSPYHQTMNLTKYGIEPNISLIWNKYIDESGSWVPENYIIYRGVSIEGMQKYDSLPDLSSFNYNIKDAAKNEMFFVSVKKGSICSPVVLKAGSDYMKSLSNILDLKIIGTPGITSAEIKAYPNPFADKIYIEYVFEKPSEVKIQVFNSMGIIISETITNGIDNAVNMLSVDMTGRPSGFYSVRITSDSYSKTINCIKE